MKTPTSIGILASYRTPECMQALQVFEEECAAAGISAFEIGPHTREDTSLPAPDMLLCFGGDGSMLNAAREAVRRDIILGGVNLGHLGYLTACGRDEVAELVRALASGDYCVEERSILQARRAGVSGTDFAEHAHVALNEVALMRAETGKMIDVDVEVDGELLNKYHSDGVLVATPTGSTAYSLAAGGPLISPEAGVLCLTPICPHSLTIRAVVLPDSVRIVLRPRARRGRDGESTIFSLDGRSTHSIANNEALVVSKASAPLRLLTLRGTTFGARLRAKLGW